MTEQFFTLDKYGNPEKIEIRKSQKAKNISIRITHKGAELVLPFGANPENGYKFLITKEYWIRQKLRTRLTLVEADNNKIPILGKIYKVVYTLSNDHAVKLDDDTIKLYSTDNLRKITLQIFLKKKLLEEITKLVDVIAGKHKLAYESLRIMDNMTRWGSCSSKGNLAFNWRIVFAPYEVLQYLVVHEMCHLKEMNHGKNFWRLVAKIYPEYPLARLWLKNNGRNLYNYLK
ncbi:M48 family metallopeptidase [Rickettsia endosymbiont of Halotydeus destructor]|uniref:M48 family metallopeptidase n=1 Tax=Rickettsia endosymbiont of Halotydeus destructor TaxID=2996754 RepID=UPI003BAE7E7F